MNNERIEKAIKKLQLQEDDLRVITLKNMESICKIAKVDLLDLMYYLRYSR